MEKGERKEYGIVVKDYERYFHSFEKGEFGSNLLEYLRGDRVREMG